MNNPRDPNNNSGKRKVQEPDPFRDLRTPAPALRNNPRRYSMFPGTSGPVASHPPPDASLRPGPRDLSAAAPAPSAPSARQDDDRHDRAHEVYQNYVAAQGLKLALQRAKERVRGSLDDQLSHLELTLSQHAEERINLLNKLSVLECVVGNSNHLGVLHNDMMPSLKDQIVSKQDMLQSLGANVKNNLNSLPSKCVQPVTMGEKLDAVVLSSEELQDAVCREGHVGSILKNTESILHTENELQMCLETKSKLPTHHESVSHIQFEVGGNVLHLQQEIPIDFSNMIE